MRGAGSMKIILFCLSLLISSWAMPVYAQEDTALQNEELATVVKIEGKARILPKDSIKKHKAAAGEKLFPGDRIISYNGTKVIIKLTDGSDLIMDEASELLFFDVDRLRQDVGEVYYKIKKRVASKGLKVETSLSIIGIKGTEFIVDLRDEGEIALNEGLIGIESLHAEFELHKEKVMQEYERYKQEQMDGFEAYKAEAEKEVVSYVKAFDLHAGRALSFGKSERCEEECSSYVSEKKLSSEAKERFERYEAMLSR